LAGSDVVQRVRIYLNQTDRWEERPRYLMVLAALQRAGASGATALAGLAGFGPSANTTLAIESLDARRPVVIEWIDRAERVDQTLPLIDPLIGDALVTREDVAVYRATLRARGPFTADLTVGTVMQSPAPALRISDPLSTAIENFLQRNLTLLPVLDAQDRFAGLLTEQDLAWRAGLRLPLHVLPVLTPTERDPILAPLIGRSVADVMSREPRSVLPTTAIPQALVTMVEWGYSHVPVVDSAQQLIGLLGQDDVLRAAVEHMPESDPGIQDVEALPQVRMVMQTSFAHATGDLALNVVLARLLHSPGRRLLVTDAEQRLIGFIDAARALAALDKAERTMLIEAWQQSRPSAAALPGAERDALTLAIPEPHQLDPDTTIVAAARQLIETGADHLPVVDPQQRLLGIIARGALIRAILQQSA
jgi:CBS domain-containing protein